MEFHKLLWKETLGIKYFLVLCWWRQGYLNLLCRSCNNWQEGTHIFNFKCLRFYTKLILSNNCTIIYKIYKQMPARTHLKISIFELVLQFSIFLSPSNKRNYNKLFQISYNQVLTNSRKSSNNEVLTKICLQSEVIDRILDMFRTTEIP